MSLSPAGGRRWAQPTIASGVRRAGVPSKVPGAATHRAAARRTAVLAERNPAAAATTDTTFDATGGEASESEEAAAVRMLLLEFLDASASIVEHPLPSATTIAGQAEEAGGAFGGSSVDGNDYAAVVRARAATTLQRQRAYVEMANQLQPMLACLERCAAALRSRRLLRSAREEASDGTLPGIAAEVEGMVEAEAARTAHLAGGAHGVADHVLQKLQADLSVSSVGEIAPRIDELTRAARLSLSLLKQLRAALDLDSSAPIATCIASAARKTKELAALEATTNHLCGLLQLHTHEALVPAVRQLSLSSRVGRE